MTIYTRIKNRYSGVHFHPMDYTTLGYLLFLGLLIIPFHNNVLHWWVYPFAHLIVVWILTELIRTADQRPSPVLSFLRTFYPALCLAPMWGELNGLINMMFPHWANDFLVNTDLALFGVHPTVWVEKLFTPWLTELMNFFYISYFVFIPLGSFTLYFKGKQEETRDFFFLVFFTYTITFFLFLIFPAEGPWVILRDKHTIEPEGGIILRLVQFVEGRGSIKGGCFPSSHVAAAMTIALATLKSQKKIGIILFILSIGVAVSTVYCRYHHAIDSIAGIALGFSLFFAGNAILKKWKSSHS